MKKFKRSISKAKHCQLRVSRFMGQKDRDKCQTFSGNIENQNLK